MNKHFKIITILSLIMSILSLIGMPITFAQSSSTYMLKGYEFGGGGGTGMNSSSYSLEGIAAQGGDVLGSSSFNVNSGLVFVQQSNVPAAPTFVNTSNWYNKLKITINKWSGDPSDTKYAIAISSDNFATDTRYVQDNLTVGSALGTEDFQTYSTWGGSSGNFIIGLNPSTTYTVKVKSMQGNYSESGWGPTAQVATSNLILGFDIDIGGASDPGSTSAPYVVSMGTLTIGSPTTATDRVWLSLDTNAEAGGYIFVYDQYGGLKSNNLNYTITSATADLSSGVVKEGFGLQGASKTQTSGGPLAYTSPYNGATENIGVINTTINEIFNTTSAPIVGGRGSVYIKAKVSNITPSSNDYADTLTMIATASF